MRKLFFVLAALLAILMTPTVTSAESLTISDAANGSSIEALVNAPKSFTVTAEGLESDPDNLIKYVLLTVRSATPSTASQIPPGDWRQDVCRHLSEGNESLYSLPAASPRSAVLDANSATTTVTSTFSETGDYLIYSLLVYVGATSNPSNTWTSGCNTYRFNRVFNDMTHQYEPYIAGYALSAVTVSTNTSTTSAERITLSDATINGQPATTSTVAVGNTIGTQVSFTDLQQDDFFYNVIAGKVEGAYKGPKQTCLDIQSGVNQTDYGAATIQEKFIDTANDARPFTFSTTANRAGAQYRLVAFMFRDSRTATSGTGRYCDEIDTSGGWWRMAAKGFNGATDEEDGSDDGSGGGARPQPVNFVPAATAGGVVGTIDDAIAALATADSSSDPRLAFCQALTIRLPGSGGIIDAGKAGILGICNTRPLLVNMINILLILAGIFFVGAVIFSGIMLVEASSDEVAIKAKKNLGWAAIGAIIVILSNWIVPFIIGVISSSLTTTVPPAPAPVVYQLEQQDPTRHI